MVVDAAEGETILDVALANGINIEHACEILRCTTCHCIVREGFDSLEPSDELEDDMLDKAWGLEPDSRLSCQARVADEDLTVKFQNTRSIWRLNNTNICYMKMEHQSHRVKW